MPGLRLTLGQRSAARVEGLPASLATYILARQWLHPPFHNRPRLPVPPQASAPPSAKRCADRGSTTRPRRSDAPLSCSPFRWSWKWRWSRFSRSRTSSGSRISAPTRWRPSGLTESMLTIIYTAAMGLSIGATALVARRTGEHDPDGAARAAGQSILLGAAVAAVIAAVAAPNGERLLRVMGASDGVVRLRPRLHDA